MKCDAKNEKYIGYFVNNKRMGKGILTVKGKEFFVEYDEKGEVGEKKRTFEGIRIMIGRQIFFLK